MKPFKFKPLDYTLNRMENMDVLSEVRGIECRISEEGIIKVVVKTVSKYSEYFTSVCDKGNLSLAVFNREEDEELRGNEIIFDVEWDYYHMSLTQLKHGDIILLTPNRILEDC